MLNNNAHLVYDYISVLNYILLCKTDNVLLYLQKKINCLRFEKVKLWFLYICNCMSKYVYLSTLFNSMSVLTYVYDKFTYNF